MHENSSDVKVTKLIVKEHKNILFVFLNPTVTLGALYKTLLTSAENGAFM